jgi:prophage antirepressor-like protein
MTDNAIQLFQFDTHEVRFIDGKAVANDVASALGYKNPADAVYRLVKEKNKTLCKAQTVDGKLRDVTVLEEPGIYQLIFGSKTEAAERFQDWVIEVLIQIRKTGSYSVHSQPQTTQLRLPAHKLAEEISESIVKIQNNLSDNNPRLAQFLIDLAISEVMPASNSLTGVKLKGVAEIAESLGLAVDLKNRSLLGKFVKKSCGHLAQQEERLVNGQQRSVACYPEDDPEVIDAIRAFFS